MPVNRAGVPDSGDLKFQSTRPALTDGQYDHMRCDSEARQVIAPELKEITLLASGARTETFNGSDFTNDSWRGIRIFLDITATAGTSETLDVKVQSKDPVSGKYFDLTGAAFAQKTATGQDDLTIYPGIAETANRTVSDILAMTYRLVYTIGGSAGQSFTFSVGGVLVP